MRSRNFKSSVPWRKSREAYLLPALEDLLSRRFRWPPSVGFPILPHGSEYINAEEVARLLGKLLIALLAANPVPGRRMTMPWLRKLKNGAVVRKLFAHAHILPTLGTRSSMPSYHLRMLTPYHQLPPGPKLRFRRPVTDPKGTGTQACTAMKR